METEREAVIQFELYHALRNFIESQEILREQYKVIPEKAVKGNSADLVLQKKIGGTMQDFLVIEVKRHSHRSEWLFDEEYVNQSKGYAVGLNANYYSLVDDETFRLFKRDSLDPIGNYSRHGVEEFPQILIEGLEAIDSGMETGLKLTPIRPPYEEIRARISGIGQLLWDMLESLSGKGSFVANAQSKGTKLFLRGKELILLAINPDKLDDKDWTYLRIQLSFLRDELKDQFAEVMNDLENSPGFDWLKEKDLTKSFTWTPLKTIAGGSSDDLNVTTQSLEKWLLNLDSVIALPH